MANKLVRPQDTLFAVLASKHWIDRSYELQAFNSHQYSYCIFNLRLSGMQVVAFSDDLGVHCLTHILVSFRNAMHSVNIGETYHSHTPWVGIQGAIIGII